MSFSFLSALVLASLLMGGVIFLIKSAKKSGENAIVRKSLEETLDDADKAKRIRDNLRNNPIKFKRLRNKYRRK